MSLFDRGAQHAPAAPSTAVGLPVADVHDDRDDRIAALEAEIQRVREEQEFVTKRFEPMVQASDIGLWDMSVNAGDPVNPNNEFWWSDEFRHMLGFNDVNDFPNRLDSWASRLHPEDSDRTLQAFADHLNDHSGRTPYDLEYRCKLKNGEYKWFRASGATLRDSRGVPLRVAGALHDIHRTKQLVDTAEETSERLRDASA